MNVIYLTLHYFHLIFRNLAWNPLGIRPRSRGIDRWIYGVQYRSCSYLQYLWCSHLVAPTHILVN